MKQFHYLKHLSYCPFRTTSMSLLYPQLLFNPWQPLVYSPSQKFCHFKVLHKGHHTVWSLWEPAFFFSLCIIPLRYIQVVAWINSSFLLLLSSIPHCGCNHRLTIHLMKDIWTVPVFFFFLANVNNAAMTAFISLGQMPKSAVPGSWGKAFNLSSFSMVLALVVL